MEQLTYQQDHAPRIPRRRGLGPKWEARRAGGGRYGDALGYGKLIPDGPRQQQVMAPVKVRGNTGSWFQHGVYLQRHGAQNEGRGVGFNAEGEVALAKTLGQWQREGDPHLFQIVLSPEAKGVDLQAFTRDVMKAIEKDLGRPLEWVAIDHHNTAHPHVHIAVRGGGREPLTIAKEYLWGGLSKRAGEVLTREIGWRLEPDLERSAQRALERTRFGAHDRSLSGKLDDRARVPEHDLNTWEKQRLEKLTERGLAWETDGVWELAYRWKEKMMEREERKPTQQKQEREEKEQERERKPDSTRQEKQKQLVRIIDDERERGR